jgi:hypothetical protein
MCYNKSIIVFQQTMNGKSYFNVHFLVIVDVNSVLLSNKMYLFWLNNQNEIYFNFSWLKFPLYILLRY